MTTIRSALTRTLVPALIAGSAVVGTPAALGAAPPDVPIEPPTVVGPIVATDEPGDPDRDYPFMSSLVDLSAEGYVEEEYFISGDEACRYSIPPEGGTATVDACDGSYTTRIVVRRPEEARQFNGTVLLEWQNVTAQYDIDHYWHESSAHIMREGYAWVGVSAQRVGLFRSFPCLPDIQVFFGCNALKTWNPDRYAPLDIPAAPGGDAYSYDIFSQAAQAVRNPDAGGPDPLGQLQTETVIALGTSQSGGRLAAYYNSVLPLQVEPVIDAFFIGEAGSAVRDDLDTPVLRLLSEVDVRSPDYQPDTDSYRHWEVAGASHADFGFTSQIEELIARGDVLQITPECDRPAPSMIPKRYVYHAAWDHMVDWVKYGEAPPIAPRLEFVDGEIARDADGNALGGIQLSEHAVATAYNGAGNGGGIFCNLFGVSEPFDDAQLQSLYKNRGQYRKAVGAQNRSNLRDGFIVRADSRASHLDAVRSGIPKRR